MRHALVAATLALAGCQGFLASPWEYAAYREIRVAPTLEERLAAAHRYLEEHPDGRFKDEVRAVFHPAEDAFYESKKGSKEGLRAYLAALPDGPHHEAASKRIARIEMAEKARRAALDRSSAEAISRVSGRLAEELARAQREVDGWLAAWIARDAFSAPLSAAKAALVVPFALSLPAPRCTLLEPPDGRTARRCAKLLELGYEVEVDIGTEPRQITLEITLDQDARGVPLSATIAGPDLFVRLEETYRVKPIAPDDTAQRAAAVTRVTSMVKAAFTHAIAGDEACRHRPATPAVLDLGCEGVRVRVLPATSVGGDDRIVIQAAP